MHGVLGCQALGAEKRSEDRHQGHTSANSKQPGKKADERTRRQVSDEPDHAAPVINATLSLPVQRTNRLGSLPLHERIQAAVPMREPQYVARPPDKSNAAPVEKEQ